MQLLIPFAGDPEDYSSSSAQRSIKPPSYCPNCNSKRNLRFHGYYERYVSGRRNGDITRVKVRRYRCRDCRLTTSLLPWFCLSYRMMHAETVGMFMRGNGIEATDLRWQGLLESCKRRFNFWRQDLLIHIHTSFGLRVKMSGILSTWIDIENALGFIAIANLHLVTKCAVTLFGSYRCHLPGTKRAGEQKDHTLLLFSSGTDPPRGSKP